MRIDKSNPLLYSELCESRMDNQLSFGGLNSYTPHISENPPRTALNRGGCDRTAKNESPPTSRERLRNLIGRITHLLIGSQH